MKPAKMLQVLIRREKQREMARKMKYIFGQQRRGVTSIEIPATDGTWVVTQDKEQIELACMKENTRRFIQANNTVSLHTEQISLLVWTGDTDILYIILEGYIDPILHKEIQDLSSFLEMPATVKLQPCISNRISYEEFSKEWNKCREFTASGKSNIHFGHFKASCKSKVTRKLERILVEIPLRLDAPRPARKEVLTL
jgi:hypothetical protein